ncbi:hypothetical protein ACEWY4_024350 [Coilia grayii]|uniref:Uncharacterized protein n=1 Tax=Coilia grayii TaxID=363190 RepID=A0ABD1J058_9TELE
MVVFEAAVSPERKGYIALDDIVLLNYPCNKVPRFSRQGDVEVNAGQNASFQCVATGRAMDTDPFYLEEVGSLAHHSSSRLKRNIACVLAVGVCDVRRNGALIDPASVGWRQGRWVALFQVEAAQRGEQDLYRCITQSPRGAAVSNFGELIVRVPPTPIAPPQLLRAGPTYLIIQLNTNSIVGDGPVIRREIEYRASHSPWTETHGVSSLTYKVWHLEPDTEYRISVLLTRPGEGGTGPPGPPLISRTKCAEPMRALRGLTATDIQPRQLSLQWEPLGYNLTRCHTYTLSLCYHYSVPAGVIITSSGTLNSGGGGVVGLSGASNGGLGGSNSTVSECVPLDRNTSHHTLRDLPPFRTVNVHLVLANPEGKKDGREVTFQTEEDIPGGIAPESLTFTPLDDMIFLKWEEPVEPNGLITQYEISYQSIESSDPSVNVPGPRRTVSKLRNETYHMFSGLHPGTTYLVSVRARTSKGFGQTALTEITTNISAPAFDYEDVPSPVSESESTITVVLRPAMGRGAPVSAYHVVVVEDDGSRKVRRRELGPHECFPLPLSHSEAQAKGAPHYYTAELAPDSLPEAAEFTVGDNHTYNGYWNSPLDPSKNYLIYFQAASNFKGETRINCVRLARKAACKDHKRALEVSQHTEEMGLILGACAGGLVVLILLLGAIVIIIKKGRKKVNINKAAMAYRQEKSRKLGSLDCSMTEQSTLQQDERTAHSFMDMQTGSTRTEQRSSVNESSSLLGGSPRRHCRRKSSPYHTGQLHPAVRVADLLQHINQMKTSEGYGFKQEYEHAILSLAWASGEHSSPPPPPPPSPPPPPPSSYLSTSSSSSSSSSTSPFTSSSSPSSTTSTSSPSTSSFSSFSSLFYPSSLSYPSTSSTSSSSPSTSSSSSFSSLSYPSTSSTSSSSSSTSSSSPFSSLSYPFSLSYPSTSSTSSSSAAIRPLRHPTPLAAMGRCIDEGINAAAGTPTGAVMSPLACGGDERAPMNWQRSFFDGWDVTKKKDKTKGRHDTILSHDRHRVKLHSLLADPNSDYVNANYIDPGPQGTEQGEGPREPPPCCALCSSLRAVPCAPASVLSPVLQSPCCALCSVLQPPLPRNDCPLLGDFTVCCYAQLFCPPLHHHHHQLSSLPLLLLSLLQCLSKGVRKRGLRKKRRG